MRTMSKGLKTKLFGLLGGMSLCALVASTRGGWNNNIYLGTGTGSDGSLSASAAFTTGAGFLSVTITNTLAPSQIISAGQTVSDLSFTLSNAPGTLWNHKCLGSIGEYRWHRQCNERERGSRCSGSGRGRPLRAAQVFSALPVTP